MISPVQKYSLSLDEAALAFTVLGREDIASQILLDAYGKKSPQAIEERLISASHSLLARDLCSISVENKITLDQTLKEALFIMTSFCHMVQLSLAHSGGEIQLTDIFFDKGTLFTAHRVDHGVAHKYFHAQIDALGELLTDWIDPPTSLSDGFEKRLAAVTSQLPLDAVVEAQQAKSSEIATRILEKRGLETSLAAALAVDLRKPMVWGSLLCTGINAKTEQVDVSASGPGFIFFRGDRLSWLIDFTKMDGPTPGIMYAGTRSFFLQQIHHLLPA